MATTDKYDRQLRLWGANGQRALGETHVVLVGPTAAGTEALKNLVLPGVGSFCVVDPAPSGSPPPLVTGHDVSCNFFLPSSAVGMTRAEAAALHLQELNPDVSGSFRTLPPPKAAQEGEVGRWRTLLEEEKKARRPSSSSSLLAVASDVDPPVLDALADACLSLSVPLVVLQSYGLMGTVRLQLSGTVPLLDPKPANSPPDLRLKSGFPGLAEMANTIVLDDLESHQHGHVPYPILLYKAREKYQEGHEGELPKTPALYRRMGSGRC
jgi:amyloid beta precursor protein binding protein 1